MQVTMLNFLLQCTFDFDVTKRWKKTQGYYDDVPEIDDPSWWPYHYVPQIFVAQSRLASELFRDVPPFVAVMRVLVTLEEQYWPPNFELVFQTNPEAKRSFDSWSQTNWRFRNAWGNLVPTSIDPHDCGCTECIIGEYVPLCYAELGMIRDLVAGYISNNTDYDYWVEFECTPRGIWQQKLITRLH